MPYTTNYENDGYGYGHAKQAFFELVMETFSEARENFNHLMENKYKIDEASESGAEKAAKIANPTLKRVREKLGYLNFMKKKLYFSPHCLFIPKIKLNNRNYLLITTNSKTSTNPVFL